MDHAGLTPDRRPLGRSGLLLTRVGFGAFKIGRNIGAKYDRHYELPSDDEADRLLCGIVDDLGINYVDTAPAYGVSDERVGRALGSRNDVVISTKVGETFVDGISHFDFSTRATLASLDRSRRLLKRDALDLVYVHSSGDDQQVLDRSDVVATLIDARKRGIARFIGFSGKTVAGAQAALAWADALMIEYHIDDRSHEDVVAQATASGVGVVVKKGLASGRLPADEAIRFVLNNRAVTSMVIGGLSLDHMRRNVEASLQVR